MIYKPMSVRLLLVVEAGDPVDVGTATIDLPFTVQATEADGRTQLDLAPDLAALRSELSTALRQAADAIWETTCSPSASF